MKIETAGSFETTITLCHDMTSHSKRQWSSYSELRKSFALKKEISCPSTHSYSSTKVHVVATDRNVICALTTVTMYNFAQHNYADLLS